jgi:hypothetical protein
VTVSVAWICWSCTAVAWASSLRLDRLHLTRSALRVLLQGGQKIRAAGLLGLLEPECLAQRIYAVADRLLPGSELSGDVPKVGCLVGINGGRLQTAYDVTRIAREERGCVRQVFDLNDVALDLAPQLLRQRERIGHRVGVLLQLGLVGLQLCGELLDPVAVRQGDRSGPRRPAADHASPSNAPP